jgi:hypothetical protein
MENEDNKFEKESDDINDSPKSKTSRENDKENVDKKHIKPKYELAMFFSGKLSKNRAESKSILNADKYHEDKEKASDEYSNLSEEEVIEATLAIVDAKTQDVSEELQLVKPDSPEEFEALASAIFLEELREIVESEDILTDEIINQAYVEALQDLSIISDTIDSIDESEISIHDDENRALIDKKILNNQDVASSDDTSLGPDSISQFPQHPYGQNIQTPLISQNQSINNYIQPNSYYSNSRALVETKTETVEVIHGSRSDMLVGLVLGYIIGRRSGRKRSEKKMQPKMDNLEEQITALHAAIARKEMHIRSVARNSSESVDNSKQITSDLIERRIIRKNVKQNLSRREVLARDVGVEKIGKFSLPALKVFHERRLPDGTENNSTRKQVEIMSESELLEKVAGLRIHGLDVVEMYRRKRLTQDALRQITKEYLRSGPFRHTFSYELLPDNEEIDITRRRAAHLAHDKKNINNSSQEMNSQSPSNKVIAEKKAESLIMIDRQKSGEGSNNYYLIFSVIAGIVTVVVLIIMMFT